MSTTAPSATRTEKGSLGTKQIPANVCYGIQTLRAHPTLIRAFGMVKQAAAEANKKLSQGQAEVVRSNLVANGLDAKRMQTAGWGEEKPIASNDTVEGRARNRRLEMVVLSK